MVYLAEGRFLGDWNGPGPFKEMEKLTHDPAALHRKLRELGAGFLMIVDGYGVALPYDDPEFPREIPADLRGRGHLGVRGSDESAA